MCINVECVWILILLSISRFVKSQNTSVLLSQFSIGVCYKNMRLYIKNIKEKVTPPT